MHIHLEPIGIIKKAGKYSEIMIYSDFENIVRNIMTNDNNEIMGQKLLIVHKNNEDKEDVHQVHVSRTDLIQRVGNVLKVGEINAVDDTVIDICLDSSETTNCT